jgi:hypothetical protein
MRVKKAAAWIAGGLLALGLIYGPSIFAGTGDRQPATQAMDVSGKTAESGAASDEAHDRLSSNDPSSVDRESIEDDASGQNKAKTRKILVYQPLM